MPKLKIDAQYMQRPLEREEGGEEWEERKKDNGIEKEEEKSHG